MSVIATARTLTVEKPGNSAVATLPRPDAACAALSGCSAPLSRRSRAPRTWKGGARAPRTPGKANQGATHPGPVPNTLPGLLLFFSAPVLFLSFLFPPCVGIFFVFTTFPLRFLFFPFSVVFFSSSSLLLLLPAAAAVVAAVAAAAAAATRLKTRLKGARRPEKGGSSATHRGKAAQGCHAP